MYLLCSDMVNKVLSLSGRDAVACGSMPFLIFPRSTNRYTNLAYCVASYSRVAGGKTPSRGKTPTHDLRATGRNPVKCLLTISVGEWPEFVLHLEQLGRVDVAVG